MMGYLKLALTVLLLAAFPSVYGGDCFKSQDVDDCRVRAEQGESFAYGMLVAMYSNGQGVPQNYKELEKSAEQGSSDAQFLLGFMYYNGQSVNTNLKLTPLVIKAPF
jgi:hypothetical protein